MKKPPAIKSPVLLLLDRTTPYIIRMSALGASGRLLATADIVRRSGLPRRMVQRIVEKKSWESVKVSTMSDFMLACDFNPFDKDSLLRMAQVAGGGYKHLKPEQLKRLKKELGIK